MKDDMRFLWSSSKKKMGETVNDAVTFLHKSVVVFLSTLFLAHS